MPSFSFPGPLPPLLLLLLLLLLVVVVEEEGEEVVVSLLLLLVLLLLAPAEEQVVGWAVEGRQAAVGLWQQDEASGEEVRLLALLLVLPVEGECLELVLLVLLLLLLALQGWCEGWRRWCLLRGRRVEWPRRRRLLRVVL